YLGFVFMVAVPFALNASPIQLSKGARIEVVESLSTKELWNATTPTVTEVAAVVVDSRMFDPEASPKDGKWRGCGIVMIGTSDLGIQPVTFRLWTLKKCELKVSATKASNSQSDAHFTINTGTDEMFDVRITSDLKVFVDDRHIGRIAD